MPLRSMKMNGFICGFQRRVWCPKWTPASSRSFIVMFGHGVPPQGLSLRASRVSTARHPSESALRRRCDSADPGAPARGVGRSRLRADYALGELEALASTGLTVLLAFLHARVARQQPFAAEQRRAASRPRCSSARATAMRSAPAWPVSPPPCTWAMHVELGGRFVPRQRLQRRRTSVSRFRYSIGVRPLTKCLPAPGTRRTRATASLRRPVERLAWSLGRHVVPRPVALRASRRPAAAPRADAPRPRRP